MGGFELRTYRVVAGMHAMYVLLLFVQYDNQTQESGDFWQSRRAARVNRLTHLSYIVVQPISGNCQR